VTCVVLELLAVVHDLDLVEELRRATADGDLLLLHACDLGVALHRHVAIDHVLDHLGELVPVDQSLRGEADLVTQCGDHVERMIDDAGAALLRPRLALSDQHGLLGIDLVLVAGDPIGDRGARAQEGQLVGPAGVGRPVAGVEVVPLRLRGPLAAVGEICVQWLDHLLAQLVVEQRDVLVVVEVEAVADRAAVESLQGLRDVTDVEHVHI
jgi:hypothetical protein